MAKSFPNRLKNHAARSLRDASIRDVIENPEPCCRYLESASGYFIVARTKRSSFGSHGTR